MTRTLMATTLLWSVALGSCTVHESPPPPPSPPSKSSARSFAEAMLEAHNGYRRAVGVPPLSWSPTAAVHAEAWARSLAERGAFQHDRAAGEGENLWRGSASAFSWDAMVAGWGSEQRDFRNGVFPDVSRTSNWADVGHYTQMVWRRTTEVGCALATGKGYDVLVCRYTPPGNVMGQRTF